MTVGSKPVIQANPSAGGQTRTAARGRVGLTFMSPGWRSGSQRRRTADLC